MTDHRYDIAVDYMDMTNDGRLWVRPVDVRAGVSINVGRYAVVRDDDADPEWPGSSLSMTTATLSCRSSPAALSPTPNC